jgi:hypothetical protein
MCSAERWPAPASYCGYAHVCRRKGCGHEEQTADATERRCPTHGMRLWPKARHCPIQLHDLRHTTASLLLMGRREPGRPPADPAAQRPAHHDRSLRAPSAGVPAGGDRPARLRRQPGRRRVSWRKPSSVFFTLSTGRLRRAAGPSLRPRRAESFRGLQTVGAAGLEPTTAALDEGGGVAGEAVEWGEPWGTGGGRCGGRVFAGTTALGAASGCEGGLVYRQAR